MFVANVHTEDRFLTDAYVRVDGIKYQLVIDPQFATVFPSKKEAKDWVKKNTDLKCSFGDVKFLTKTEADDKFSKYVSEGTVFREFTTFDTSKVNVKYNEKVHTKWDVLEREYIVSKVGACCETKWPDTCDGMFDYLIGIIDDFEVDSNSGDEVYLSTLHFWLDGDVDYKKLSEEVKGALKIVDVTYKVEGKPCLKFSKDSFSECENLWVPANSKFTKKFLKDLLTKGEGALLIEVD